MPRSVAAVYSSHMIEHLDRDEARAFLEEVWRVLSPGGIVRIAAPDLSLLIRDYGETGDADEFVTGTHMGLSGPPDFGAGRDGRWWGRDITCGCTTARR